MSEKGALVKFGAERHLVSLRDEGLLHMNNLPYFWSIEDPLRGDKFDSVDQIHRGRTGRITLPDGTTHQGKITKWDLRVHPQNACNINLFCMYALRPDAGTYPVDERNFGFGQHALVITNVDEFISRLSTIVHIQQIECFAGLVEYVDDDYVGVLGPLKKLQRFAYQSEWRLVCRNGPGTLRELKVGNIADISEILRSVEINDYGDVGSPH